MFQHLYIEKEILDHPRVEKLLKRFPHVPRVVCSHYKEVFNRQGQNFRLQKQAPALVLAKKYGKMVFEVPQGHGIGGSHHFYFSHLLNCPFDCRYCFLQGMFPSAFFVLFINYEDFKTQMLSIMQQHPQEEVYFFSGYDCDSLALENITHFAEEFLPFFADHPQGILECRTKSTHLACFSKRPPIPNCIIAYSLTPKEVQSTLEAKTPSLQQRLKTLVQLQTLGWRIALRFDPLIFVKDYAAQYRSLFTEVFAQVKLSLLHSVSLGAFRLPKKNYKKMHSLYPQEKLFLLHLEERGGMVSYQKTLEENLVSFCMDELQKYVPEDKIFPICQKPSS